MKYITFLKENQAINIYDVLKKYIPSSDQIILETHEGISVSQVDDNFKISNLKKESINFFNIKIYTLKQLITFLNSQAGIQAKAIGENSDILTISHSSFDDLVDNKDQEKQPYNNWVWNKDMNCWRPPVEEPKLSVEFTYSWNQNRLNWDIELRNPCERKYRGFLLWRAVPTYSESFYGDVCSNNNYMIKSFEDITHGTMDFMSKTISNHGIQRLDDNPLGKFKIVTRHETVLDLAPHAIITYDEIDQDYIDQFSKEDSKSLWAIHPQCIGSTLEELLRLIIEWGLAYLEFGNREPIAVISDRVLRAIQMPLEVRNALLEIPAQTVEKYIKNDSTLLIKDQEDPIVPEFVKHWIMEMYRTYSKRLNDQEVYVNTLLDSYPM
jgi:hypothetical protein